MCITKGRERDGRRGSGRGERRRRSRREGGAGARNSQLKQSQHSKQCRHSGRKEKGEQWEHCENSCGYNWEALGAWPWRTAAAFCPFASTKSAKSLDCPSHTHTHIPQAQALTHTRTRTRTLHPHMLIKYEKARKLTQKSERSSRIRS